MSASGASATLEPLVFLEDEPVVNHRVDELGLSTFAHIVAGAALGTAGPFTIGIFGDWGQGKSSVLKQTRSLLDEASSPDLPIVTVMFNAWQFEQEEHPIVPLVAAIVEALEEKLEEWKSQGGKILDRAKTSLESISATLRAIAYSSSAKIGGGVELAFDAAKVIERYDEIKKKTREPLLGPTLHHVALKTLAETAGTEKKDQPPLYKIVVLIDDLDRCLPPLALRMLESTKVVLAQRGFIFVLALDHRIVQGYLTYRYATDFHVKDYDAGPSYLDKIVQLPLYVPAHHERFDAYIGKLMDRPEMQTKSNKEVREAVIQLKEVLAVGLDANPRKLLRFVNNLIVDRCLWMLMERHVDAALLGLCAVARIIRNHLGDGRYQMLLRSQELCQTLAAGGIVKLRGSIKSISSDWQGHRIQEICTALEQKEFLGKLFQTEPGRQWLSEPSSRAKVDRFLAMRDESGGSTLTGRAAIENAIRRALKLPKGTVITEEEGRVVTVLDLIGTPIADGDLALIAQLPSLRELRLDATQVTDAGLVHLQKLPNLESLLLAATRVTDAGLLHLQKLQKLKGLSLDETQVTDAGLLHLQKLQNLERLSLFGTQVTDAGLVYLEKLQNLRRLWLMGTQVTDAGLVRLQMLQNLVQLLLAKTHVTDAGLVYLQELQNLEEVSLDQTQVTDGGLMHLKGLAKLKWLSLSATRVTDAGVANLKAALPQLEVLR